MVLDFLMVCARAHCHGVLSLPKIGSDLVLGEQVLLILEQGDPYGIFSPPQVAAAAPTLRALIQVLTPVE